jgi:hypothetical protein
MSRRAWSTSGLVLTGLLLVPSLAVGQRCPVQMQLWYQVQMQQQLMSQFRQQSPIGTSSSITTTYGWPPPASTVLRPGYSAVPGRSNMSWKNQRYDLFSSPRGNEPRVPRSSTLLRRTDLFENLVKIQEPRSPRVTPYRETGLHPGRSPLENPFLSPWKVPIVPREVVRSEYRVPVLKEDVVRRTKIPVSRYYHVSRDNFVWRFYLILYGPTVGPSGWGGQRGVPYRPPYNYRYLVPWWRQDDKKPGAPTGDAMAPPRPSLQLQVRLDFTCGHCHLGGGRPGPSVVSPLPNVPASSGLDLLLPQPPRSPVVRPVLRLPASAVRLPLVPSPLATLPPIPSSLTITDPLGPSATTTNTRTPSDPGASALSILETLEHPVIGSAVQPPSTPGPSLLAPPLPPLAGSALQEPGPPPVAPSPVRQPDKVPDKPVASRPPPLPPLPQTAS